jgi:hypothetical protein
LASLASEIEELKSGSTLIGPDNNNEDNSKNLKKEQEKRVQDWINYESNLPPLEDPSFILTSSDAVETKQPKSSKTIKN